MDDNKILLNFIKKARNKIIFLDALGFIKYFLSIGLLMAMILQIYAFITPAMYVNEASIILVILAIPMGTFAVLIRKRSMHEVALLIDSKGFKERIITAFSTLDKEGEFYSRLRQDAIKVIRNVKPDRLFKYKCNYKTAFFNFAIFTIVIIMAITPSKTKEQAKEKEQIQKEISEIKEEIKETLEVLNEVDGLSQEEIDAISEELNQLLEEYSMSQNQEELQKASERMSYKTNEITKNIEEKIATDSSKEELLEALKSQIDNLNEAADSTSSSQTASNSNNSSSSNESGESGNNENGESGNNESGESGNNENGNGENGENGENRNGESGENENGNSGENGSGENGENSGSGKGEESQNSQQSGSGSGIGAGMNQGSNEGKEDTSPGTSNMISVPNSYGDDDNLKGENTGSNNIVQGGISPTWSGNKVNYNNVISNYSEKAYSNIGQNKYPSGVNGLVKDYFDTLNR